MGKSAKRLQKFVWYSIWNEKISNLFLSSSNWMSFCSSSEQLYWAHDIKCFSQRRMFFQTNFLSKSYESRWLIANSLIKLYRSRCAIKRKKIEFGRCDDLGPPMRILCRRSRKVHWISFEMSMQKQNHQSINHLVQLSLVEHHLFSKVLNFIFKIDLFMRCIVHWTRHLAKSQLANTHDEKRVHVTGKPSLEIEKSVLVAFL